MRATPPTLDALPTSTPDSQRRRYSQELAEYSYQQYATAVKAAEAAERMKQHEATYPPKPRSPRSPAQVTESNDGDDAKTPMPKPNPNSDSNNSGNGGIGSGIAQAAIKAVDFALRRDHKSDANAKTTTTSVDGETSDSQYCTMICTTQMFTKFAFRVVISRA